MPPLNRDPLAYRTRLKGAWSDNGIYFLFDCEDQRLSTANYPDHSDVWKGDSLEIFLWPHEDIPVYFQYDISPLGAELPLLVPNNGAGFVGWSPCHYEGPRRVRARTVVDGAREPLAAVVGWQVELFIPYRLLSGLLREAPGVGTLWRGNVYRLDYDSGSPRVWTFCDRTGPSAHEFRNYGAVLFTR